MSGPGKTLSENVAEKAKKTSEEVELLSQIKERLEKEIDYYEEQIEFISEEIERIDEEIEKNEKRLIEIEEELKEQRGYLSESLRVLYELEQITFWERLVTASSLSEVFSNDVYMESVREKLAESVDRIIELQEEEKKRKAELAEQRNIQEALRASLALEKAESEVTLEKVEKEELIIREKFARMLSRDDIKKWCVGEGRVIKAKHPVFKFPVECGYVSQGFGNTIFAAIDNAYGGAIHNGFDVGVRTGTPIYAVGDGEVYARGRTPSGGWGNWIMIKHDPVKIKTGKKNREGEDIYKEMQFYSLSAHMVARTHLKVEDRVNTDTVVGFVGGTPYWAPHLHFSLFLSPSGWADGKVGEYPGNVVNPLDYMDIPISTIGTDWDSRYVHF